VELKNKLAVVNGFTDYSQELIGKYEDPNFESDLMELYNELKPLYLQLHAYMRRKLFETYGSEVVDTTGKYGLSVISDNFKLSETNK